MLIIYFYFGYAYYKFVFCQLGCLFWGHVEMSRKIYRHVANCTFLSTCCKLNFFSDMLQVELFPTCCNLNFFSDMLQVELFPTCCKWNFFDFTWSGQGTGQSFRYAYWSKVCVLWGHAEAFWKELSRHCWKVHNFFTLLDFSPLAYFCFSSFQLQFIFVFRLFIFSLIPVFRLFSFSLFFDFRLFTFSLFSFFFTASVYFSIFTFSASV